MNFWKVFIPFLMLTLAVEITGSVIYQVFHQSNHWLYNLYLPLQIGFVGWIFYKVFPPSFLNSYWFIGGYLILLAIFTIESIQKNFIVYNNITDLISTCVFVVLCGTYYYYFLNMETYTDILKLPAFWFVTGVFLFNFGSIACTVFSDELMHLNLTSHLSLRYAIFLFLDLIIYTCWMYSFKCRYQETISS